MSTTLANPSLHDQRITELRAARDIVDGAKASGRDDLTDTEVNAVRATSTEPPT